mgnify:FL=1
MGGAFDEALSVLLAYCLFLFFYFTLLWFVIPSDKGKTYSFAADFKSAEPE